MGKVKNHLPIIPNVKRCFRLVNTSFELPYIKLTTYVENFYPEKLKMKGARGGLLKNRKGKNDRFRNYNKHVNSQEAT